jgi:hypothetical protein
VAQVQHDALAGVEQPVHRLPHPRRCGGIHLALNAHDLHPTEIVG